MRAIAMETLPVPAGADDGDVLPAHLVDLHDTIPASASIMDAIAVFRRLPGARYLAVVDAAGAPCGTIREIAIRDLLYSPFGHALLANPGCRWTLAELIHPCATADIASPVETIVSTYAAAENGEGMILTESGRYAGLLPAQALLKLSAARERRLHARRLDRATAAIHRSRKLGDAIASFEHEAAKIGTALADSATEIRTSAAEVATRARLNSTQAAAVAAAADQSARGVADMSESTSLLRAQVGGIQTRVHEAKANVREAIDHVAIGSAKVRGLTAAADEIGDVVSLITGIARTIDMLALNATIEAVRAGVAGRSFAVVANEVKALADETGRAAEQIAVRIGSIRGAVSETTEANARVSAVITRLDGIAEDISDAVAQQSAATVTIAVNVEQAAEAAADISSNIADMDDRAAMAGDYATRMHHVADALAARADGLCLRVEAFLAEVSAV